MKPQKLTFIFMIRVDVVKWRPALLRNVLKALSLEEKKDLRRLGKEPLLMRISWWFNGDLMVV